MGYVVCVRVYGAPRDQNSKVQAFNMAVYAGN